MENDCGDCGFLLVLSIGEIGRVLKCVQRMYIGVLEVIWDHELRSLILISVNDQFGSCLHLFCIVLRFWEIALFLCARA